MSTRFYPGTLANQQSILGKVDTLMQPVGACGFAVKDVTDTTVELKWQDPANLTLEGFTFAEWASTTIVKKQGSAPASISDGTTVVTTTTRDQYRTTAYVDSQSGGSNWYYRAFPTATNGKVNTDAENIFSENYLFGYYIDENDSNEATCVHYFGANADYTPMSMDFTNDVFSYGSWANAWILPKPCMLKYDGTVDYYLNPANYLQKENGTASDANNSSYGGNAMLEMPAIFMKVAYDNDLKRLYFYFSNRKLDSTYECWSCKKSDGTYAEHFYLPCYEGSVINGVLRSISTGAVPTGSTTQTQELSYARQNGSGWNPSLWADEQLLRALFPLVFKRLNSQAALGSAYTSGVSTLQIPCGTLNSKGLFYGSYFDGSTANTTGCKFFGMEQPWGHRWRRAVGINLINGQYYVKMTQSTVDGSAASDFITTDTASDYTAGYMASGIAVATNWSTSYIKTFSHAANTAMLPLAAGSPGSSTTYACDAAWSASGTRCFFSGGCCVDGFLAGVFALYLNNTPSTSISGWNFGSSLSYREL